MYVHLKTVSNLANFIKIHLFTALCVLRIGLNIIFMYIVAYFIWTFVTAFIMFILISMTTGLGVSTQEEAEDLDISEYCGSAYSDFDTSSYVQQ